MEAEVAQVRDRRLDVSRIVASLDLLAESLLKLRLAYSVAGMLYEWSDEGVDPLSSDVVELRSRLQGVYDGLDFALIEEWL